MSFWQGMPLEEFEAYLLFDVIVNWGRRYDYSSWTWAGWTPAALFAIPSEPEPKRLIKEIIWYRCKYQDQNWALHVIQCDRIKSVDNDQAENLLHLLEAVSPSTETAEIPAKDTMSCQSSVPSSLLALRDWNATETLRIKQVIANYLAGHKSKAEMDLTDKERRAISRIIQSWMMGCKESTALTRAGIQISKPEISADSWALALLREQWKGPHATPSIQDIENFGLSKAELDRLLVFRSSCASISFTPVDSQPLYVSRGPYIWEALVPPWTIRRGHVNLWAKPATIRVAISNKIREIEGKKSVTFVVIARRLADKKAEQTDMAKSTLELMAIETDQRGISSRVACGLISMNDTSWAHFRPTWKTVYLL